MSDATNERPLEEGIERDFSRQMSYGDYLQLDTLLSAQRPLSDPPQHDELLFIIQHQTTELWLKLLVHELRSARPLLATDDLAPALKRMARVKHIQHTITDQWSVLATLTPSEYAEIRPFLATSSGFQSAQYREVEFLLGNKNADMVKVFAHDPDAHAALTTLLYQPLAVRRVPGLPRAPGVRRTGRAASTATGRSPTAPTPSWSGCSPASTPRPSSTGASTRPARSSSTSRTTSSSGASATSRSCSARSATRPGTGGSSGVDFLRRALDLTFFPELYEVRTLIGE